MIKAFDLATIYAIITRKLPIYETILQDLKDTSDMTS